MPEKTIPWWRKALQIALSGLRSGFGIFPRPAMPEPVPETVISRSFKENREEERALTEPSRKAKKVVAAPAIHAEPVTESISIAVQVAVVEKAQPAEPARRGRPLLRRPGDNRAPDL